LLYTLGPESATKRIVGALAFASESERWCKGLRFGEDGANLGAFDSGLGGEEDIMRGEIYHRG